MRGIVADLRLGVRSLSKSPGFVAVVVLTLALGIGANTAVFSGVHFALLQTIEATEPGELVWVGATLDDTVSITQSFDLYEQLRDLGSPFQGVCAYAMRPTAVRAGDVTEQLQVGMATSEFFPLLGVSAALGRVFGEQDRESAVAVLEHDFWRDRMGADPTAVGKFVYVTGKPYTVIGVAPQGFRALAKHSKPALWVPIERTAEVMPGFEAWDSAGWIWLNVFARLPQGADRAEAQAAAELAWSRHVERRVSGWSTPNPERAALERARRVQLPPAAYGNPRVRDRSAETLTLLAAVVGLILLLACANVANLMLGRTSARRQEIATQLALGASRFRVARRLLAESLILAVGGGFAGIFIAWTAAPWVGEQLDLAEAIPLHWEVLAFSAFVSGAAGVLFGVAPAWASTNVSLAGWLRGGVVGERQRSWGARGFLVALQAALCIPVLVASGLLLQTLENLYAVSTGLAVEQVAQGTVDPRANGLDGDQSMRVLHELQRRLTARPEVRSAAFGDAAAFSGWTSARGLYRADSDEDFYPDGARYASVSEGFFPTLGIRILAGRDFAATDTAEAPKVVIVNQALAKTYFGDESPIGRRVRFSKSSLADMTIVGLVADSAHNGLRKEAAPFFYRPVSQAPVGRATIYARTAGSPEVVTALFASELAAVDSNLPPIQVRTLADAVDHSLRNERRLASLLTLFGALGLAIAAVGLYGVLAYAVARRRREMGLRKALGAQARDLTAMLVGRGLSWVAAGAVIGLGVAWAARGLIESKLYGLEPADPYAYAGAGIVLVSVAFLAALTPAWRAARVEPAEALRHE